jgi:hypothetical protein
MSFPFATACMETEEEPGRGRLNHGPNIRTFLTHDLDDQEKTYPTFITKVNKANSDQLYIRSNSAPEKLDRSQLQTLRLTPEIDHKSLFAEWAHKILCQTDRSKHRMKDCMLLIRMGADLHYQADCEQRGPTLFDCIADSNCASVVHATIAHIQESYPRKKVQRGRKVLFTLFCWLRRSGINLPRDIKKLLIDKYAADLLTPPPEHFEHFMKVIQRKEIYKTAYTIAQKIWPEYRTYNPELLNPETAHEQYRQAYLDNCARFRKTIFK